MLKKEVEVKKSERFSDRPDLKCLFFTHVSDDSSYFGYKIPTSSAFSKLIQFLK